jgi:hypothetical protein
MAADTAQRDIAECDEVYRTGAGGYWRAAAAVAIAAIVVLAAAHFLSGEITMDRMLIAFFFLVPLVLFLVLYAVVSFMVDRNSRAGMCPAGIHVVNWTGYQRFIPWDDISSVTQVTTWGVWNNRHRLMVQTGSGSPLIRVRISGSRQGASAESLAEWTDLRDRIIRRCGFEALSDREADRELGEKPATIIERKMWA